MSTTEALTPPMADATPDEAFELGRIAGYDEAMREAHEWVAEGVAHFESKAAGNEAGRFWLAQVKRCFDRPIVKP